jgi:hypothetical protein
MRSTPQAFTDKALKMFEQSNHANEAGGMAVILAKFFPAAVGAALMIAVDPPKTKRDLFARAFVAFAASYLFGDLLFDFLHTFSMFAFLENGKRSHQTAVDGFVGAVGWFVAGGLAVMLKRFRTRPLETMDELIASVHKSKEPPA